MENIKEIFSKMPYISESNIDEKLYNRFQFMKSVMDKKDEKALHLLNKANITGIWLFTNLKYEEENPQLLIRTTVKKRSLEYMTLCAEIHEFIKQDVVFDYDTDLSEDGMIIGQKDELIEEILSGRILTVYDKEREN